MANDPYTDEKVSCTGEVSGFLQEKLSSVQFECEQGRMQIKEPYLFNLFRNYYSKLDVETSGEANIHWGNVASTPTTLVGYGITDAQSIDATLTALAGLTTANNQVILATGVDTFSMGQVPDGYISDVAWSKISSTPITLAGYGITDALASPLTAKGDIWTYSTVNTRLGIGTDTYVLKAASGQATGLAWGQVTWGEVTDKPTILDMTDGADNRVCTAVDANTIKGEQNLTFSGSKLTVIGSIIINGDDGGIVNTFGLTDVMVQGGGGSATALSEGIDEAPISSWQVAKWWKVYDGTTSYLIPLFT